MTTEELERLVAGGEGETLEWKETTGQRRDACETLCAFLNGAGGIVVFGVTCKGKLTGQLLADTAKRDLFEAFQAFEPAADVNVEYVPVDETHAAIICRVERGNVRPYVYDGRPYKRVQSSTTVMRREEYNRMLKERRGFASPWESEPNRKLTLDDIDLEEVKRTARKAVQMGRLDSSVNTEDAVGLLDHFKLREKGVLLNGAAVLFAKGDLADYPHLQLKMGWFRGTTDREFLDNRHVFGNVFKQMDEAMAFCFKHLNLSAKISGKIERDEELEVPAAALREALINAFAHREYDDGCRTVYLAVYSDRVEIKSPGGFPSTLRLDRLYDPPVRDSQPRNPRIARVLYLCKMIETWGRGLGVIAGECKRVGLPLPVTAMEGGSVVTTFVRPKIKESGSHLDRGDPDSIQIGPDRDPDPEREFAVKLLQTIQRNPLISRKLLSVELSVSERKVRKALDDLKKSGVILRQGPEHGGIWRISIRQDGQVLDDPFVGEKTTGKNTIGKKSVGKKTIGKTSESLIDVIKANDKVTTEEMAKILGLSVVGVRYQLRILTQRGRIRRVGGRKLGHWEVLG